MGAQLDRALARIEELERDLKELRKRYQKERRLHRGHNCDGKWMSRPGHPDPRRGQLRRHCCRCNGYYFVTDPSWRRRRQRMMARR